MKSGFTIGKRLNPPCIISNNCWGTYVYQKLGGEYHSPLVNLFMAPSCYIKLASSLRDYLSRPLVFVDRSMHDFANANRETYKNNYPIGLLGDVELHFLHYDSCEEAAEKWLRRSQRVDFDNLFFKFDDTNGATGEQIELFDALPYERKVCFSAKPMPHLKSVRYIESGTDHVPLPMQPLEEFVQMLR